VPLNVAHRRKIIFVLHILFFNKVSGDTWFWLKANTASSEHGYALVLVHASAQGTQHACDDDESPSLSLSRFN
jgi:hypothetical protein